MAVRMTGASTGRRPSSVARLAVQPDLSAVRTVKKEAPISGLGWQFRRGTVTNVKAPIPTGGPSVKTQSLALELRAKRSEMMILELEAVALRLFEQRGFGDVTVEEIASEAHISARTFYRYFPTKEDVLQVRIERRSEALRAALSTRPADEPPLLSLRLALEQELATEDPVLVHRWIAIIAATPSVLRAVLGGIQLKSHRVMAEFLGSRLGSPSDALVPTMLAAAAGGVIQAAQTHWYFHGGDLAETISESLEVLEGGLSADPRKWSAAERPKSPGWGQSANRRKG
jgi:AcrR family transcriptional regulator